MRKQARLLILSLMVCGIIAPAARAHKYHTSVTRIEYNEREAGAEITIQTFRDDLEDILTKRAGRRVSLEVNRETQRLVFDYLKSALELKRTDGSSDLQWVGMEVKGETVLLYVLSKMPEGLSRASLRHALLFDLFEDQVNIVNVFDGDKKSSLVFKRGDGARQIP
jgi:hypothetical protein